MAIAKAFDEKNHFSDISFEVEDFAIGGKLLIGSVVISEDKYHEFQNGPQFKEFIKMELATELAKEMIMKGLVEFTVSDDNIRQTKMIRVRAYLAPNDQIKVLRTMKR